MRKVALTITVTKTSFERSVFHTLYFEGRDADLWRDGHKVTEELRWDLSQLKHLYRSLDTYINEQDVQHSAAVQVGDLTTETWTGKPLIFHS